MSHNVTHMSNVTMSHTVTAGKGGKKGHGTTPHKSHNNGWWGPQAQYTPHTHTHTNANATHTVNAVTHHHHQNTAFGSEDIIITEVFETGKFWRENNTEEMRRGMDGREGKEGKGAKEEGGSLG